MDVGIVILLVVLALVLIVVIWAIATYNGFVKLRNLVQEAWRQIDVELHRRYDLLPNLIETVKGYAAHERAVFDEVTRARAQAASPGTTPAQQAAQEDQLSQAIGRLFAVAENYPQLQSVQSFTQLQAELTNTEDRIAAGRRFYNANVRTLNTKVETFPPSIIAGMFNFTRAEYFEVNDPAVRTAPQVSFQDQGGNVGVYSQGQPARAPMPTDSPVQPGTQPPAQNYGQSPPPGQPGEGYQPPAPPQR
ncbi:LemA family protein [Ruania halotolerans]|uniref:LemA family protein n=1 Tax=Ruania halotolerans TaxID=2897773 RepID=UPI001E4A7F08|nr:LemA family protein [Ruania halotolerans]UFU06058.1 LemA family protein [Ruania halotolerans]